MHNSPLFQFLAHDACQRAHGGLGDVRHLKGRRVQFVAGPHGADDRGIRLCGTLCQKQLAGDGVDGIHDIVVLGEIKLIRRVRQIEAGIRPHNAGGVDVQHPLPCHIHLQPAHGGVGGKNLAVQIGNADGVVIDQIQHPHAAPGQCLHGVAAHAAHAEYGDPGSGQLRHGIPAQQELRSGKLLIHARSLRNLNNFLIPYPAEKVK